MKYLLLGFCAFFIINTAIAERVTFNFNERIYRNKSTIGLKQLIRNRFPRVNLNQIELNRVTLVAKSARGGASAILFVGNNSSRRINIPGNRFDFQNPGNYFRINFISPRRRSVGRWQIQMNGHIKVRRIIVDFNRRTDNNRSRQCTYVLETNRGRNLRFFTARARANNARQAKRIACRRAKNECLRYDTRLTRCSFFR